jgi:hypothetical protein
MKKVILSMVMLFIAAVSASKVVAQTHGAMMEFAKETHDYGTIKNGADGTCVFEFKNTGDSVLLITNARGSCGCTVPEWPKEGIAPGATATIKVSYDTKRTGPISKSVTISSNAKNTPEKVIFIKGEVLAPEPVVAPEAPVEPSKN